MADEVIFVDEKDMMSYCIFWQQILKLEHWEIRCLIVRKSDLQPDTQAGVTWTLSKALAILKVMDPIDYDNKFFQQDHEVSLVHELLHPHMASFDITKVGSLEETFMERSVEHIAKALVLLKRRGASMYGVGKEIILRVQ